MPALPPVPNVIRLDFDFIVGEDLVAKCRRFLQYTGTAPSHTDCVAIANAAAAAFAAHLPRDFRSDVELVQIHVVDLTTPTSGTGDGTFASIPGTGAATSRIPASSAMVESGEIARRYRGGHPRVYWPMGFVEALADSQTWTNAFVTQVQGDLDAFNLALKSITWTGATIANIVSVSFYNGFRVFTGSTGRARNISIPRVTPLIDAIGSTIARHGVGQIRKRLLGLA
jgi:hypothetical protein